MKYITIILAFLALPVAVWAQDGDSVLTKHIAVAEHLSLKNEVLATAWNNPALMEMAHATSLTQFSLGTDWSNKSKPHVLQKGTGHMLASIKATSFLRLSQHSAVWGKASYMTGKMRGIKWNSVADYDLLEPDVLGDTVGGDTRREQYVLEGGYSRAIKRWHVGGELKFRAEQEYRKVDPRMRSIVSDLTLRAGASRMVGGYHLALGVEGNIYRQTNSVDFYKPLGSIPEFQLMGLGTTYTRFSGDINDLYFKGGGVKLQADLLPAGDSGVFSTVGMAQHSYKRVARMLNSLPLTTLYNKEWGARVGYKQQFNRLDFAMWANFSYNRRTSDQHLAGTSSSQIYPVIAHLTMYKNNIFNSSLQAMLGNQQGEIEWNVKAQCGYCNNSQEFVFPHREMKYGCVYGNLEGQVIAAVARAWSITAVAATGYYGNTSRKLVLPLADMEPHFIDMLTHNFNFLSADYFTAHARLRTDYHFSRSRYSIFAEAGYGFTRCTQREYQHSLVFAIGVNL